MIALVRNLKINFIAAHSPLNLLISPMTLETVCRIHSSSSPLPLSWSKLSLGSHSYYYNSILADLAVSIVHLYSSLFMASRLILLKHHSDDVTPSVEMSQHLLFLLNVKYKFLNAVYSVLQDLPPMQIHLGPNLNLPIHPSFF